MFEKKKIVFWTDQPKSKQKDISFQIMPFRDNMCEVKIPAKQKITGIGMKNKPILKAVEFKTKAAEGLLKTGMVTHDQHLMLMKRIFEDVMSGKDLWMDKISTKNKNNWNETLR